MRLDKTRPALVLTVTRRRVMRDSVLTVPVKMLGRTIGYLSAEQEAHQATTRPATRSGVRSIRVSS